jgi:hypothetical protein
MTSSGCDVSATGTWLPPRIIALDPAASDARPAAPTRARLPTGASAAIREVNRLIRRPAHPQPSAKSIA